jgi:hypothetical protein
VSTAAKILEGAIDIKKALVALLAALTLCGCMAVGAAAFEAPFKPPLAAPLFSAAIPQDDSNDEFNERWRKINEIMNPIDAELNISFWQQDAVLQMAGAMQHLTDNAKAYKAGKTEAGFWEAVDANILLVGEPDSLGEEEVEAAYAKGTLAEDYRTSRIAELKAEMDFLASPINEYFLPEALAAVDTR